MCLEQAPYKRLKLPGAIVRGEAVRMVRHVLVMLLLLSSGVAAQDSSSRACADAKTTLDVERCASRMLEEAKSNLSKYLQEARRVTTNRVLLDSAQAAWEHYRDLTCRAAGRQRVAIVNCLGALTRRRVRELYDHYLRGTNTRVPAPTY